MFKTENEVVNSTGDFKVVFIEKMIFKLGLCRRIGSSGGQKSGIDHLEERRECGQRYRSINACGVNRNSK